jgi:Tol biopolymer transport system component
LMAGVCVLLASVAVMVPSGARATHATATKRAGTIAFLRLADGPFGGRVFVVRPDGSALRPVTPPNDTVVEYAWSPDRSVIAYIDRALSLWLVRADGTGRRLLLSTSHLSSVSLSWAPDGREIAIVSAGPNADIAHTSCDGLALYLVPVAGGTPHRLPGPRQGFGCDIAWAPRGDEIAYGDGPLGLVSTTDGRRRVLVKSGVGAPLWSPDGTKLAFPAVYGAPGHVSRYNRISAVDATGRNLHVVTDRAYTEGPFAWSPDGRQILYARENREGIYAINPSGRNNRSLTTDAPPQAGWSTLGWSPTGESIIYAMAVGRNNTDLYLVGTHGRHKVQLTSSSDVDIDPSWVAR